VTRSIDADSANVTMTGGPGKGITPAAFRDVLSMFATGVTVVSTTAPTTQEVRGMTANAFMSVSLSPALVLVSVRHDAHLHGLIHESKHYGVSLLSERLEHEARRFAGMPMASHIAEPEFADHGGIPVLRDALGWLTAAVVDEHPAGDHTLFIGEILDLGGGDPGERPLGFYQSSFAEIRTLPREGRLAIELWDHPLAGLWG
jgi:flavin reductase (DIM6/NTAB) family NADH-FMN oxidoreductase RutF